MAVYIFSYKLLNLFSDIQQIKKKKSDNYMPANF